MILVGARIGGKSLGWVRGGGRDGPTGSCAGVEGKVHIRKCIHRLIYCTEGLGMVKRFREILGRPINWHVWHSRSLMRIKSIKLDCLAVSADRYLWVCIDQRQSFVIAGSSVFLY